MKTKQPTLTLLKGGALALAAMLTACQGGQGPVAGGGVLPSSAGGANPPPAAGNNPGALPGPGTATPHPGQAGRPSSADEAARSAAGFGPAAPPPLGRPTTGSTVAANPTAPAAPGPSGGAGPIQVAPGSAVVANLGPPNPLVVGLAANQSAAELLSRPALAGFRLAGELRLGDRRLVKLEPPAGLGSHAAALRLRGQSGVRHASVEGWRRPSAFAFQRPDPFLNKQWAHQAAFGDTHVAWNLVATTLQAKVIVAVLDAGVDLNHPEFAGRFEPGFDARFGVADPLAMVDESGHGTHVAGVALAAGDNAQGVAGVAWGARLLAVKVLGAAGGSDFDVLAGMAHAINYRPVPDTGARVRVINMSLGGPDGEVQQSYVDAIEAARQVGITVVVAAGNEALDLVAAPASTPGAIAVGATHRRLNVEAVAPYSNRGPELALVAPGSSVFSTLPLALPEAGEAYGFKDGTSMSAPYVAGAVALMAARYDPGGQRLDATWVDSVRRRLAAACDDLGPPGVDPASGAGRLNLRRALTPTTLEDQAPS